MSTLNLSIDLSDQKGLIAMQAFLTSYNGGVETAEAEAAETKMPAKTTKEKVATKAEQAVANKIKVEEPENVSEEVAGEADKTEKTAAPAITREELRALVATKIDSHRETVKEKMTSLGAKNMSSLEEKHFNDFNEFLQGLK